ncbi:hypothetical protein H5410_036141 [Solanum commersonii]|uniref:Uncharacterized protein n=1 Tax=Solanum commersonii TaxID=4109 RepID=A0A9J5Y3X4_SOLCO|nr:hypothetical protein H5410_036141 [Solanum commersonii]
MKNYTKNTQLVQKNLNKMSKEIHKGKEDSVQILEAEEDHRGYALKPTFDGELFKKIQGLKVTLKIEDNMFNKMQRMFARHKIFYHEYQEIEKVIEITQTTGRHKLKLLTKPMIEQILRKIPEKKRKKMNYVHLGGIQILVKSTFKEGINCPIVINLSNERFINAREGNLGIIDGNHIISIYYQALYTVTNSNYGNVYKNNEMIEIDQECAGIARNIEAEIQQAQISDEYEIHFGKTQEIESSGSNPRLLIEYRRNSIKKSISNKYPKRILKVPNITRIAGRIFNGIEWKKQEILLQTGATANHVKDILLDGLPVYEGTPYTYKTFEGNNYSCIKMVDLPIQLDTIRITASYYITNHEGDHNLILVNLFLNSLEDYSIGKNGIEINYKNETCFIPKI